MTISVVQIQRPYAFLSPVDGQVFAALLLVVDPTITTDERASLAEQLVAQGCRHAACAGFESTLWDDAIDMASVMAEIDGTPQHGFVMTTWHGDEPLEEVVEYFQKWARIDDAPPAHRVAIILGEDPSRRSELLQRLEAQ